MIMNKFFAKLSIKFFRLIYKKQDERQKRRLESLKKKTLSGNICGEKYHTNSAATLTIKSNSDTERQVNQKKIKEILEKSMKDKDGLFKYIENSTTKIYKIKFADKILEKIGETEGFIMPKKGLKALYLNLILNKKISFKTPEMFVLRSYDVNLYAFIYQFYNWYCYKMNLSGYSAQTQEMFKNVFQICESDEIKNLNYDEILKLKSAIKRDIEAINFVIDFVKEKSMAKKNLDKIVKGEKVRV